MPRPMLPPNLLTPATSDPRPIAILFRCSFVDPYYVGDRTIGQWTNWQSDSFGQFGQWSRSPLFIGISMASEISDSDRTNRTGDLLKKCCPVAFSDSNSLKRTVRTLTILIDDRSNVA